jgi:hypothetical protein
LSSEKEAVSPTGVRLAMAEERQMSAEVYRVGIREEREESSWVGVRAYSASRAEDSTAAESATEHHEGGGDQLRWIGEWVKQMGLEGWSDVPSIAKSSTRPEAAMPSRSFRKSNTILPRLSSWSVAPTGVGVSLWPGKRV